MPENKYLDRQGVVQLTTDTKGYVDTQVNTKQDTLIPGTNIKNVNGESILSSGNIEIPDIMSIQEVRDTVGEILYPVTSAQYFTFSNNVVSSYNGPYSTVVIPRSYSMSSETIITPIEGTKCHFNDPANWGSQCKTRFQNYVNYMVITDGTTLITCSDYDSLYNNINDYFTDNNSPFLSTPFLLTLNANNFKNARSLFNTLTNYNMFTYPISFKVDNIIHTYDTYNGSDITGGIPMSSLFADISLNTDLECSRDGESTTTTYSYFDGEDYQVDTLRSLGYHLAPSEPNPVVKKVILGEHITHLDNSALRDCPNLNEITMSDNIISIGSNAFTDCTNLTEITIPENVEYLMNYRCFYGCTGLRTVKYSAKNCIIADRFFSPLDGYNNNMFYNAGAPDGFDLIIGQNVELLYNYLFNPCNNATYAPRINNIIWEGTPHCTKIGRYTFAYNNNITSFIIPSSIIEIDEGALFNCPLTNIIIPNNVQNLGVCLFGDDNNISTLESITFLSDTPPALSESTIEDEPGVTTYVTTLSGTNCPIYVPANAVETYKTASIWNNYANRIEAIPNN